MDYLVEFLESGGARIIKDPILIEKKWHLPNVILNPDISHLKGVSPSFWIREGETIGAHAPSIMEKMVKESLSENHPFDSPNEAPFSSDSKFIKKIEEIDAKQDKEIANLHTKIMFHQSDIYAKMRELKLDLDMKDHLHAAQIKSMKKLGLALYFSCILAIILIKFL